MESNMLVHRGSQVTVNDLPDELLRMIFSHFPPQQLCSLIAHVCSKWHQFSRDPMLWKKLTLKPNSLLSAVKLFRNGPLEQLKALKVDNWDVGAGDTLLALISAHCPSVESIHIAPPLNIKSISIETMAVSCPQLSILSILRCSLNDGNYAVFAKFPKLRNVRLEVQLRSIEDAKMFDGCTQLRELGVNVSESTLSPNADEFLSAFVERERARLQGLFVPSVSSIKITDAVATALSHCDRLLALEAVIVSDVALESIATLKDLGYMCLKRGELLSNAGLISAFSNNGYLCSLTQLGLIDCPAVHDNVVQAVANRFSLQLEGLVLDYCSNVSDDGICRAVAKCSNLQQLSLNGVPRLKASCLWAIPKCLPKLKKLSIKGCQIDPETVTELKAAIPNLIVITE